MIFGSNPSPQEAMKKHKCPCGQKTTYDIWFDGEEFSIRSCCGGGCEAADNIKFCPYCGEKLVPHHKKL